MLSSIRRPSRALSHDERPTSQYKAESELTRLLRQSSNITQSPLSDVEQQESAAYRDRLRSTLNHYQISGIQISLRDTQESEQAHASQRATEHESVMSTLRQLDTRQIDLATKLVEVQMMVSKVMDLIVPTKQRTSLQGDNTMQESIEIHQNATGLALHPKSPFATLDSRMSVGHECGHALKKQKEVSDPSGQDMPTDPASSVEQRCDGKCCKFAKTDESNHMC